MKTRLMLTLGGVVAACVVGASIAVGVAGVAAAETEQKGDGEPLADAGLDQTVTVDTTVQLDGAGSTDPDGSIERYAWSIRSPTGDPVAPACSSCERTRFVPTEAGRYAATLRVTDGDGDTATDTLFVYVGDAGPSVEISGDRTPEPDEVTEYTAAAESSGAELVEIAWSVDDDIVAIRPLAGHADESTFRVAFTETDTHRVQAVVRDASERTDYDELLVQPQDRDDPSSITWRSPTVATPEAGCSNGGWIDDPDECLDLTIETPEPTVEEGVYSSVELGTVNLEYGTDGFYHHMNAGSSVKNSEYMGAVDGGVGIDGGENAPWRQTTSEQVYDATVGGVGTFLFGQEEEIVTCQMTAGEYSHCGDVVHQLENEGETTNVHSPDESGAYSKYGLKGGERVAGSDPATLEDGQTVEVTIVTQPEKEGAISKSARTLQSTSDSVQDTVDDFLGGGSDSSGKENESTASEQSTSIIDTYHTERQASRSSGSSGDDRSYSTGSSKSVSLVSGHSHSTTPSRSGSSSSDGNSGGTGSESTVGLLS